MDVVILSIPIFFVLIGLEVGYDVYQNKKGQGGKYRLNDAFTNISCGIVDQLTGLFSKLFTVGAYVLAFELLGSYRLWEWSGLWWHWVIAFIAIDLAYYWSHRVSHQVNLFWVGHVVHHQSEDYNLSVALRQGAFQKMLMFWVYLPLAAIGLPAEMFAVCMGFNLLYQFWIHTEYIKTMGPLEWVLNTPSHHRVHHGRNPKYIDKNHAGVLIIWDRMFGTFQKEEETPTYGITRPTNTFNPVMAHAQPFIRLFRDVRSVPGIGDKLRFLFNSPGWYPASMGGPQAPPEIDAPKKYELKLPLSVNLYLFSQYFGLVGFTALFLFTTANYALPFQIAVVALIMLNLLLMGGIFDARKKARNLEWLRQFLNVAFAMFLFLQGHGIVITAVIIGFVAISVLWFLRVNKHLPDVNSSMA